MGTIGRDFITAGRAIFTISNETSGERYTFKVTRKDPDATSQGGQYRQATVWFVALLTGPDNEADYNYMGLLVPTTGQVRLTRASRYLPETKPVKVFNFFIPRIFAGRGLPAGYAVRHEGKCGRCGRTLTVPESIDSGFGPECAGKIGAAA